MKKGPNRFRFLRRLNFAEDAEDLADRDLCQKRKRNRSSFFPRGCEISFELRPNDLYKITLSWPLQDPTLA